MNHVNPADIYRTPEAPLSQATTTDDRVYVSGQIPRTSDGEMVTGDVRDQTERVLANLEAVLAAGDASLDDLLKLTVFLRDMDDLPGFNEVYSETMPKPYPARSVVEVSEFALPDVDVEIEAVAER